MSNTPKEKYVTLAIIDYDNDYLSIFTKLNTRRLFYTFPELNDNNYLHIANNIGCFVIVGSSTQPNS